MSKREKIIVAIMIAAGLFAVYTFFGPSASKKKAVISKAETEDLDKTVSLLSQQLMQKGLSTTEIYLMERAQELWQGNPFREPEFMAGKTDDADVEEADDSEILKYIYSGFIRAGRRVLCILNDMEYEAGEPVGETGCIVKRITREKVIVTKFGREIDLFIVE